jgi:hypothetical protein
MSAFLSIYTVIHFLFVTLFFSEFTKLDDVCFLFFTNYQLFHESNQFNYYLSFILC